MYDPLLHNYIIIPYYIIHVYKRTTTTVSLKRIKIDENHAQLDDVKIKNVPLSQIDNKNYGVLQPN